MVRSFISIAALAALVAGPVVAQDAPAAPPPTSAAAEWQIFSRSSRTAYLVDVHSLGLVGDTTSVMTARAPFAPEQDEPAWSIEEMEFRCAANQYRLVKMTDFNADGSAAGPAETLDDDFETISPDGLSGYLKGVVCEDQRANPPYYSSLQAWIAAGRK